MLSVFLGRGWRWRFGDAQALPAFTLEFLDKRRLGASAVTTVHAAEVAIAAFCRADDVPATILAEVGLAAAADFQPAVLAGVAVGAAHAAAGLAGHGVFVLKGSRPVGAAAGAAAGNAAALGRVEGREADALAAVLPGHGAVGGVVRVLVVTGEIGVVVEVDEEVLLFGEVADGRDVVIEARGTGGATVAAGGVAVGPVVPGLFAVFAGVCPAGMGAGSGDLTQPPWMGRHVAVPVEHFLNTAPAQTASPRSLVEIRGGHGREGHKKIQMGERGELRDRDGPWRGFTAGSALSKRIIKA